MREEAMDRRVRKTRRRLKECFIRLLKEKKIQDISVRELADMADINRGTFYLHYRDVYDLLEAVEQTIIDDLNELLAHYPPARLMEQPSLLFLELYPLVKQNADTITALLGENGDLNFSLRMENLLKEVCLTRWISSQIPGIFPDESTITLYSAFIVSGCLGVIQTWIAGGFRESPEEMARITEDFIVRGIRVLNPQPALKA